MVTFRGNGTRKVRTPWWRGRETRPAGFNGSLHQKARCPRLRQRSPGEGNVTSAGSNRPGPPAFQRRLAVANTLKVRLQPQPVQFNFYGLRWALRDAEVSYVVDRMSRELGPVLVTRTAPHTKGDVMEKLLLTPEEAGEVLGVGRSRVYDLMRTRELQSVRIGKSRRVPAAAVQAYVDQLTEREAVL